MKQLEDFKFGHGCAGSEWCECHGLAIEAWGPGIETDKNSGVIAFAYLWRRFGPPWIGTDDHKKLVGYWLGTPSRRVVLTMDVSATGLAYSVGYLVSKPLYRELTKPESDWWGKYRKWFIREQGPRMRKSGKTDEEISSAYWDATVTKAAQKKIGKYPPRTGPDNWRKGTPAVREINESILAAMAELLRPVYVRDVPINILGRCEDSGTPAEKSIYAGYGVPKEAMDKQIQE